MRGRVIKSIGAIGLTLSLIAILVMHPLPSGPAMFKGAPQASQLLRDNPQEQELLISRSDLEAVLRDIRHQRKLFMSSLKTAVFFNVVCIVLCFMLYRVGKRMEQPTQLIGGKQNSIG